MLEITIPEREIFIEDTEEFYYVKGRTLQLEHSLVSISKWEKKWKKPFLHTKDKTREETIDYIKCMTLTQNVSPDVYLGLTSKNIDEINRYIEDPMTATTINKDDGKKSGGKRIITSELIYCWMIMLNIPVEFQKWHLNRLITLIEVCNIEQQPPKKMSKKDLINRNRSLNEARKAALGSKG